MFKGNKTYLLIAAAIGCAIAAYVLNSINIFLLFEAIFAALAIGATRARIKKIEIAADLIPPTWATKAGITLPQIKTHLAVVLLIVTACLAFFAGKQGPVLTAFIIAAALGISALRVAIQRLHDFIKKRLGVFGL